MMITLADVLAMIPACDNTTIQEPAEEHTTGVVFNGKCSDFRATFEDAGKHLVRKVTQLRPYKNVIIIGLE